MFFLRRGILIAQTLGVRWVLFRIRYALRRKSGGLRRANPVTTWDQISAPHEGAPGVVRPNLTRGGAACVHEAEEVLRGAFRLFSGEPVDAGSPPNWHRNQLTGEEVPTDRHWSDYGDFSFGDIKGVWELSRFTWAYSLTRAYAVTREERFAEGFWRLFEDWLLHNPPNTGPNWMCGQEATFRLMATTFAVEQCTTARASTPERVDRFSRFVRATGMRVVANLDYALSQSNNHGVSECVGLITAAGLLPASREGEVWKRRGLEELRRQLTEMVYLDGAFSQHSAIYHRVLLDDLLWVVGRLRRAEGEVPDWLMAAGRRAVSFLAALTNPATGRVPLYGANDGAQVLPLADAEFLDFRPVVQAGFRVFHGRRWLPEGPWDEKAEWLLAEDGGRGAEDGSRKPEDGSRRTEAGDLADDGCQKPDAGTQSLIDPVSGLRHRASELRPLASLVRPPASALRPPAAGPAHHFPDAGCLLWRSGATRLFFRCPTRFRHRPSQADLLHVDLEWRGQPIVHDAGTYSYNTSGRLSGALKEASVHNTVTYDSAEPMQKAGRFLYLPWPRGTAGWNSTADQFHAEHDGWQTRGLRHRRSVQSPRADEFIVTDELAGTGPHRGRLHWLVADGPYDLDLGRQRLILRTAAGDYAISWQVPGGSVTLVRGDPDSNRGWWAPHYAQAEPALSLAIEFEFTGECRIETKFGPA